MKSFAKKVYKSGKKAIKKRYIKNGNPKIATMARDIMRLKAAVNVEKKTITVVEANNVAIGQCETNFDTGAKVFDLTPEITQGVGVAQRTGNEIKLVSMCLKGQIKQQTASRHPMKIKLYIIQVIGQTISPITIPLSNGQFLEQNVLTSCTDYNSNRNVEFFKNYKIMKVINVTIPVDQQASDLMIKDFSYVTKLSHHIKYNGGTTTVTNGQFIMMAVADSGNSGATVSTLPNVPITAANSGATIQFYTKFYYVDN